MDVRTFKCGYIYTVQAHYFVSVTQLAGGVPKGPHVGRLLLRKELAICALLILCRHAPDQQLFVSRAGCVRPLTLLMLVNPKP